MAHTPGPWTAEIHSRKTRVISGATWLRFAKVYRPAKSDYGTSWAEHDAVSAANARLIAAAPDLLAACEFAIEAIRLTREYVGEDVLPAIEGWSHHDATKELTAAIAKAKGGQ